jgi:DNA adenine methylase
VKAPLVWAGAKAWHAPMVAPLWVAAGRPRIVEPFAGGLSVSLALEAPRVLANDANPHLINFYEQLRGPRWLGITHGRSRYFELRALFNATVAHDSRYQDSTRAELFYYLNRHAFNGLWRVNRRGQFNVPPRPGDAPTPAPDVAAFRRVTRDWTFASTCWRQVDWQPGDFIYADPPYDDGWTGYTEAGFAWRMQEQLARELALHPGPVVLMNKATRRIVDLYLSLGFHCTLLDSKQAFQRSQGRTDTVKEVMATLALPTGLVV